MIALVSPVSGIAGDMFLAALLDAGASLDAVRAAVAAATGGRVTLDVEETRRAGLRALALTVRLDGEPLREAGGPASSHEAGHAHAHAHGHETEHGHQHEHDHAHGHADADAHGHRSWTEIRGTLQQAALETPVRDAALSVFTALAEAEAFVHGQDPGTVHFHEVGGWDAVADIVGVAAALHDLGVDAVHHGPIAVGGGMVRAAHGVLPVPAPATARLLEGRPCTHDDAAGELTTPTGAALLCALARPTPPGLAATPVRGGTGAGRADPPGRANVLRVTLAERAAEASGTETVCVVEATLDDATPEEAAIVVRSLLRQGARDATLTPLIMKKGRPGFLLRVLGDADDGGRWAEAILRETPSLGARWRVETRRVLPRRQETVDLDGTPVRVKVATGPDGTDRVHVEADDLERLHAQRGGSLAELRRAVERQWRTGR